MEAEAGEVVAAEGNDVEEEEEINFDEMDADEMTALDEVGASDEEEEALEADQAEDEQGMEVAEESKEVPSAEQQQPDAVRIMNKMCI